MKKTILLFAILCIGLAAAFAQSSTNTNPQMEQRIEQHLKLLKERYPDRFAKMDEHELQMFREQEMQMMQHEKQFFGMHETKTQLQPSMPFDYEFGPCNPIDSLALVAFYNATNGANWYNNTNWLTGPVFTWYGISTWCERFGQNYTLPDYVMDIELQENNLSGSIPVEIGNFMGLKYLLLSYNQITGSIPPEIGNLDLWWLWLYSNQLTGSIPPEISNLISLSCLFLSFNQLTGSIPPEIGNLTNLQDLWMDFNEISGSIPPEIGNLTSLQELVLYANQITGIPPEIGNLTNLQELDLYWNQITGIPPEIGNLTNLHWLGLGNNQITGSIPPEIGNLTNLHGLVLNNNQITGSIPPEICNLTNLLKIYLFNNQLTGSIPIEICNIPNLIYFAFGYNYFDLGSCPAINCLKENGVYMDDGTQLNGNNLLTDCMNDFSTELMWTNETHNGYPLGVVSDGSAAIKIRINRDNGDTPVNSIQIQLQDVNGQSNIPLGAVGTSIENATNYEFSITNPSGNDQWDFFYVAPDVFSYDVNTSFIREIKAVVTIICDGNDSPYVYEQIIKIIRPPVLLIHGLKDSYRSFTGLQQDLINSGRYINTLVKAVNYENSNDVSFVANIKVISSNIEATIKLWQGYGYEVKKVDLVGHSMGGILSRLYLQSPQYKDDIHKLITVNTPHSGSQGANVLCSLPQNIREIIGFNGYAVNDLRVNSPATRQLLNGGLLNDNVVPSHAIITETDNFYPVVKNNILGIALYIAFSIKFPEFIQILDLLIPILYNGDSDLIVAENSQIGGLSSFTVIGNEWHNGAPNNPLVKTKIIQLLELPTTNGLFSVSGFHPDTITWDGSKSIQDSTRIMNDSIYFVAPAEGILASNGQGLNINIIGSSGISKIIFYAKESQDSIFTMESLSSSLNFNYTIPQTSSGKIEMYAFGFDNLNSVCLDSTYISVQIDAFPDSLFIGYPQDSLVLSQGMQGSVYVSCLFSDNIVRDITTLPNVQYSLKTNNAIYVDQGILKGIHQGIDTLTVSYSGLSTKMPVFIAQYYTQIDSVNISAEICEGESYNFYGQLLDVSGIYDTTFINQYGSDSTVFLNLSINPLPELICPADLLVSVNGLPVELNEATPTGGTYSGPGVTGGLFNPGIAGVGEHTITYSYANTETGCTNSCTFQIIVTLTTNQQIPIDLGWSGISSFIVPDNPDLVSMFAPIQNQLVIVNNFTNIYSPFFGIPPSQQWNAYSGYFIKLNAASQLQIWGGQLQNRSISLLSGWNLIPVLSECEVDVTGLFASKNVIIIKEVAGWNIFWPEFGINSLGVLEPGKAYFVLMGSDGNIEFPACDGLKTGTLPGSQNMTVLPVQSAFGIKNTPITHTIAIPKQVANALSEGDIISVYDENGNCFGVVNWQAQTTAITIFGNDPTTAIKDGFDENEPLQFRLYRQNIDKEFEMGVTFNTEMPNRERVFHGNGLSAIKEMEIFTNILEQTLNSLWIFPNPSSDILNISGIRPGTIIHAAMISSAGKTLNTSKLNSDGQIDVSKLSSGIYFLKLEDGNSVRYEKVVVE